MIKNITVRDFRGIAEGTIEDFAKVNIFVGPNNTGKTTILEALYLTTTADVGCSLVSETGDSFPAQVAADYDMLGYKPMVRIWQRHNFPARWPNAPARWKQLGYQIEFFGMPDILQAYKALEEKQSKGGFVEGDEQQVALLLLQRERNPNWKEPDVADETQESEQAESEQEELEQEPKYYPLPPVVKAYLDAEADADTREDERRYVLLWHPPFTFDYRGIAGWHVDVEGSLPAADRTLLFDFHTTLHHFSQSFIDRGYKIVRYWQRRLGEHMARVFDLPNDPIPYVSFSPYLTDPSLSDVLIDQYGRMVSIDTWGDGARHAMKLLVALIFLHDSAEDGQPGMVLWEDPELFLHPKALHGLFREVLTLIKDLPIQLFITTQSLEAVASLTTLVQEMDLPTDMLRAFQPELSHHSPHQKDSKPGEMVVSRFKHENLVAWLKRGLDPRYIDEKDRLLEYHLGGER